MVEAGYSEVGAEAIKNDVTFYENLRNEIKLHSGDAIDLKRYEPAMRHLINTYIRAEESKKVSAFDDLSLVQLIVERGADAVNALPDGIRKNKEAAAETIENNVRKLIIDESPINPKYYEKMSKLLDALIEQRRQEALDYATYLAKIVKLTKQAKDGPSAAAYPQALDTPAKRALYDNLHENESLALEVDTAIRASMQDDWRSHPLKIKKVKLAIKAVLENPGAEASVASVARQEEKIMDGEEPFDWNAVAVIDALADKLLELAKNQNEY